DVRILKEHHFGRFADWRSGEEFVHKFDKFGTGHNWLMLQPAMQGKILCTCLVLFVLYQEATGTTPLVCSNGGTPYVDNAAVDRCLCTVGFIAPSCADPDPCIPSPCKNHGTCTITGTGKNATATCQCLPGFTDMDCGTEIYPCDASPCERGACLNNASSYHCVCPPAYTGQDCETYIGYCGTGSASCTGNDVGAVCSDDSVGYTCACSSEDFYGFNCESKALSLPPGGCGDVGDPESYCLCSANGETVKVPLERPWSRSKGVNWRDFVLGSLGLLLGWLLGTAMLTLYYCCCKNNAGSALVGGTKVEPIRPYTTSSVRSESTTLSNYMHQDSKPEEPSQTPQVTGPTPAPSATIMQQQPSGLLTPTTITLAAFTESRAESSQVKHPTNIYRAGFVDDMTHKVSHRKSSLTYMSAQNDWK
ncbi:hypothetical protein EGW08_006865, partial [Elysia chlorotica]